MELPPDFEEIREPLRLALVGWFARHQRDLPWRHVEDPYAVWVSEVMLQQTQVDRVRSYYSAFLKRFPTIATLAEARVEDVLSMWRGLGYYSRARNLHRAAQMVVEQFNGELPRSTEALGSLPGFGRYTVGAVASIAFGQAVPLVDGNVARVFSRLFAIDAPPGDKARDALLWAIAEELVEGRRPGDLNQALMELGATICVPSSPLCLLCPVQQHCQALKQGRVHELPWPKKAAARKRLELAVAVCSRTNRVLLARRPESGLFGGLWEMPSAPVGSDGNGYAALRRLLGKGATIGPEMSVLERTLTHRELSMRLHPVTMPPKLKRVPESYLEWRWVERAEAQTLGMSSAMSAALELVLPGDRSRALRYP